MSAPSFHQEININNIHCLKIKTPNPHQKTIEIKIIIIETKHYNV